MKIRCTKCGKPVSGAEIPEEKPIRAFIECPECAEKTPDAPAGLYDLFIDVSCGCKGIRISEDEYLLLYACDHEAYDDDIPWALREIHHWEFKGGIEKQTATVMPRARAQKWIDKIGLLIAEGYKVRNMFRLFRETSAYEEKFKALDDPERANPAKDPFPDPGDEPEKRLRK